MNACSMIFRFSICALLLFALPARAGEVCMSDWGAAGEIVRREGLRTVEQLAQASPQQLKGEIVRATLCQDGGAYVYRLVVRASNGQLRNVVLTAADAVLGDNSP